MVVELPVDRVLAVVDGDERVLGDASLGVTHRAESRVGARKECLAACGLRAGNERVLDGRTRHVHQICARRAAAARRDDGETENPQCNLQLFHRYQLHLHSATRPHSRKRIADHTADSRRIPYVSRTHGAKVQSAECKLMQTLDFGVSKGSYSVGRSLQHLYRS